MNKGRGSKIPLPFFFFENNFKLKIK